MRWTNTFYCMFMKSVKFWKVKDLYLLISDREITLTRDHQNLSIFSLLFASQPNID